MNPATKPSLYRGIVTLCLLFTHFMAAAQVTLATALPGCLDGGIKSSGISCGGGTTEFGISGNSFIVRNIDGASCCGSGGDGKTYFEFPPIHISGFKDVSISISYTASSTSYEDVPGGPHFGCTGNLSIDNGHDQILFTYSIDDSPFILDKYVHGTTAADFTGTWNAHDISGTNLKIRIWASNKAAVEIFSFSNLTVTGIPSPVSAGPDQTVCGFTPVTLSASGPGSWLGGKGTFSNPNSPLTIYTPSPDEIGAAIRLTYRSQVQATCSPINTPPEDQMILTINAPPKIFAPGNQSACEKYILPPIIGNNLKNAGYFTGPGGSGRTFLPGEVLNSPITLYAFDGVNGCYDEVLFHIDIHSKPQLDPIPAVTTCGSFVLPSINGPEPGANPAYFTLPNGNGEPLLPGTRVTASGTYFAFSSSIEGCSDEKTLNVHILPQPQLEALPPQTACDSFLLPTIRGSNFSGHQGYYTLPNGNGIRLRADTILRKSGHFFVFDALNTCTANTSFTLSINHTPSLSSRRDTSACGFLVLPKIQGSYLSGQQAYFTGTLGSGLRKNAGDTLFTSTSLYLFDSNGFCTDQDTLQVTIYNAPRFTPIPDTIRTCTQYQLPPIAGTALSGQQAYFTGTSGSGHKVHAGQIIRDTTRLYLFDKIGTCAEERPLTILPIRPIQIDTIPDILACEALSLPPITGMQLGQHEAYFTGPGGSGQRYLPGHLLKASSTLYAFGGLIPGCTSERRFKVTIAKAPIPRLSVTSPILCYGESSAALRLEISKGTPPFRVQWEDGTKDSLSRKNLPARTYRVTITDSSGCTAGDSLELVQPAEILLTCNPIRPTGKINGDDGEAEVGISGGTGRINIQIDGPVGISQNGLLPDRHYFTHLKPGYYAVRVTDSLNCTKTGAFFIAEPICSLKVSLESTAPRCASSGDGTIAIQVHNGTKPFQFDWNNPHLNGKTHPDSLKAGTYQITVTDAVGCADSALVQIQPPPPLELECLSSTPTTRLNGKDGTQSVRLAGGKPPYQLMLTGGREQRYAVSNPGLFTLDSLPSSAYALLLTDSEGCMASICNFIIEMPRCDLVVELSGTDPTCSGSTDGRIKANIFNAKGPLQLLWNPNWPGHDLQQDGLPAGAYQLEVIDDRLCKDTASIELKDPPPLRIRCNILQGPQTVGGTEGIVQLHISGGTAPRAFTWNGPGFTPDLSLTDTFTLNGLPAGTYSASIADAHHCADTCSLTLAPVSCTLKVVAEPATARCFGESSGSVRLRVTGARGDPVFRWSNSATSQDLPSVPAGSYSVTVTDAARCKDSAGAYVFNPAALLLDAITLSKPSGPNQTDARASLHYGGGAPPYRLSWEGPSTGNFQSIASGKDTLRTLPVGTYTVTLRDSNGCTTIGSFTIEAFRCQISATIRQQAIDCQNAALITSVSDAREPVYFDWDHDELDGLQHPAPVKAGTYRVQIRDTNGCSVQAAVEVTVSGPLKPTLEVLNGVCAGDSGSIFIEKIKGGRVPYAIALNHSQAKPLATIPLKLPHIKPGQVGLSIHSSDGCRFDTLLYIKPIESPLLELGADREILSGDSVELDPQIEFEPETLRWIPETGLGQPKMLGTKAGPKVTTTYLLRVTDQHGCSVEDHITVFVRNHTPVFFPSAFSPDGDGTNDYFTGFASPIVSVIEKLLIFDRWGKLLFEGHEIPPGHPSKGWNGHTKNGEPVPPGVYIYKAVVRLQNGKTTVFAGEITAVR